MMFSNIKKFFIKTKSSNALFEKIKICKGFAERIKGELQIESIDLKDERLTTKMALVYFIGYFQSCAHHLEMDEEISTVFHMMIEAIFPSNFTQDGKMISMRMGDQSGLQVFEQMIEICMDGFENLPPEQKSAYESGKADFLAVVSSDKPPRSLLHILDSAA